MSINKNNENGTTVRNGLRRLRMTATKPIRSGPRPGRVRRRTMIASAAAAYVSVRDTWRFVSEFRKFSYENSLVEKNAVI
ncbi:hypothetical protein Tco_0704994 [Tanacetum coccineum]|uniref:Uncharacterized protein n=1 Tax=Tanacetum coccineum TaxID=301880 RepID=A0ABQ4Y5B9_9ASTR